MQELQGGLDAQGWAVMTYGSVRLGDERRTQRAVQMASAMARDPMGSLPKQLGSKAATKGAYRFLESGKTSYEQLLAPHVEQTRAGMAQTRLLLIQDMTEIDYTHHPKTQGLGPVGKGKQQQGYLLQTVLAVEPESGAVLGIAAQEALLRQPAPPGETSHQRDKRQHKESQVWQRQVQAIGPAPADCEYIHVGDRGSDIFAFLRECGRQGCGFLVRVQHDRRMDLHVEEGERPLPAGASRHGKRGADHEPVRHLFEEVRGWQSRGQRSIRLESNQKRGQREVRLQISWGRLRFWPPDGEAGKGEVPLVVTVVRAWEADPPEGVAALEWLLVTSVAVTSEQEAWQRVQWYRMRWIVEDYHQCLKTGCQIEARQVQSYEGLRTLLGFLAPLAVRLLQLRAVARAAPEQPAQQGVPAEVVQVVAHLLQVSPQQLTARQCWHRIAQAGGYLGRKGDGEPGWKTLWKGWLYVQTLIEGIHLASELLLE
jgi:hypothetical protein